MPDAKTERIVISRTLQPKTKKLILEVTLYIGFSPENDSEKAEYMDAFWDAFHELERKWNSGSLNLEQLPGKMVSHEYEVKEETEE